MDNKAFPQLCMATLLSKHVTIVIRKSIKFEFTFHPIFYAESVNMEEVLCDLQLLLGSEDYIALCHLLFLLCGDTIFSFFSRSSNSHVGGGICSNSNYSYECSWNSKV